MQDVRKDRDKYIGGSDVPAIMHLSPFKQRWSLLLEKAGYEDDLFEGNEYTHYGQDMEPVIRDYVSELLSTEFKEDKRIEGSRRYHADGYADGTVLEIKTTSQLHKNAADYKAYMVQLQMGIDMFGVESGVLAVYERPDDFSKEFDPMRLQVFKVDRDEEMIEEIRKQVDMFLVDLEYLKENPLASEGDLPSRSPIVPLANEIIEVENKLAALHAYKDLEKQYTDLRARLKVLMTETGVDSYTAIDGTKFTLVADGKDKEVDVFNEEQFRKDNPGLWETYTEKQVKKGRAGYVKITTPRRNRG